MDRKFEVAQGADISAIRSEYRQWTEKVGRMFGIEQALHHANLMEIENWNDTTPPAIAKFVLKVAPRQVKDWLDDRSMGVGLLGEEPQIPGYLRVKQVRQAIIKEMEERKPPVKVD
jgi:hypothetical protein